MCVVYNVIAKCKCLVRVFIDSIHWFDSLLRFLTSIHWFDSLIRFITSIDWSLRSLEFKAANQCSDLLGPLKKSPDAYSIEFRLFHVASAASWVASPSPVCSVVTFLNGFRKSRLPSGPVVRSSVWSRPVCSRLFRAILSAFSSVFVCFRSPLRQAE